MSPYIVHCHWSPNLDFNFLTLLSLTVSNKYLDSPFGKFKIGRDRYQHNFCIISRDAYIPLLWHSHFLFVDAIAVPPSRSPSLKADFAVDLATFCPSHALLVDILCETSVLGFLFWSFSCSLTVAHTPFHISFCKKSWPWPASSWEALYQENREWQQISKEPFASIKQPL